MTPQKRKSAKKKQNKKKIIWLNSPFSLKAKTNVGKIFLKLVKSHFPKEYPLHKIFHKNTLAWDRILLSAHNGNIIYLKKIKFCCNCRSKTDCSLDNKCLTHIIVYKTDVPNDSNNEKKFYLGLHGIPFKKRFRNYKKEFPHKMYWNGIELSIYI